MSPVWQPAWRSSVSSCRPSSAPLAAYVPAVRTGNLVYTAGQLPMVDGELPQAGKVGAEVTPEAGQGAGTDVRAQRAGRRRRAGRASTSVTRVVKVVGFVASAPGFTGQPGVINGASELFGEVFGEAGAHARSAVGVSELPLDAPVEVELIVEVHESTRGGRTQRPGSIRAYGQLRPVTETASVLLCDNPGMMTLDGTNTWVLRAPRQRRDRHRRSRTRRRRAHRTGGRARARSRWC